MLRHFVIVGQRAKPTPDFSLDDLPGSSGRLDVLIACLRAGLMVSHGLRTGTVVHLVLQGGERPCVLRFRGDAARFLRPDERSLATLIRKCLQHAATDAFTEIRPGIDLAQGDLAFALAAIGPTHCIVLDEHGDDVRTVDIPESSVTFVLGDDRGFTPSSLELLNAMGARRVSVGPVSLHAADAITVVHNGLDHVR